MDKINSVDGYLKNLPAEQKAALERIRNIIRSTAPEAQEGISYGMPAYKYHGLLVGFAAYKKHCTLFVMNNTYIEAHNELDKYDHSKSGIRFSPEKPLPVALIKKIVRDRMKENKKIAETKKKK